MPNLKNRLKQILSILCVLSVLTGCGFSLRGSGDNVSLPPQLQTLQLQSVGGNSELLRLLRRSLNSRGIELINVSEENIYRLNIGREQLQERILSVTSNARAGEYELSMSVTAQLIAAAEGENFTTDTFSVERVYLADSNNAVAKAEEAELIQTEMRRELVNQILRSLQNTTL